MDSPAIEWEGVSDVFATFCLFVGELEMRWLFAA